MWWCFNFAAALLIPYSSFYLPDDNIGIFAASQLILYCSFSSLILSSVIMISFYILSKRLFLKRAELSEARVVSIKKKEYGFSVNFL